MSLRDRIKVYATYGGAWEHLGQELIREGFSTELAALFIATFRYSLGHEAARYALDAYDEWCTTGLEEVVRLHLILFKL